MKKCAVIYNPHSGKKHKEEFMDNFLNILSSRGYESKLYVSKYKGNIMEIVESLPNDIALVISLGGDGTFNESMRGNFKRKKRLVLAHIPLGTTNDIGKMFGYGKNVLRNLMLLLDGEIRNVDICTINNEPFVYVAGFGKFMNVAYDTNSKIKNKIGYSAYLINALENLLKFTKMHEISYVIDNEEYNGLYSFILIANATRIAGISNIFEDVKLNDNKFEIVFCNIRKRKDILKTLYYLKKDDIAHVPGFYVHKTDNIKIKFNDEKKITWCIDGEKFETEDNKAEIAIDKNVQIMIPKTNIDKLFL